MKRIAFRIVLVVLVVSVCFASYGGNVVAQSTETPTPEPTPEERQVYEEITHNVDLVDYEYDEESGFMTLWFDSGYEQEVTITDAFIPSDCDVCEVNQKHVDIDGRTQVRISTTEVSGRTGVTVTGGEGLYAAIVDTGGWNFETEYSVPQVFVMFVMGGSVGITLVLGVAFKRQLDYTSDVEKKV